MREFEEEIKDQELKDARRAHIFLIIIAVISAMFLTWCLLNLNIIEANREILFLLGVLLVISEVTAVRLPHFGFAAMSLCIYLAVIIISGPALGGLLAFGSSLLRDIVRKQWGFWEILTDVSVTVMTICISGMAYMVLAGGAPALSARSLLATLAMLAVYLVVDYLISSTALGMLSMDVQRTWSKLKIRARWLNIGFAPIAFFILPLTRSNPWFILLLAIPLIVLRLSMHYAVKQEELDKQEDMNRLIAVAEMNVHRLKKENADLSKDLSRKVDELSIFFEVGQTLGSIVTLEDTLAVILSMLRKLIAFQSCVIFLLEGDSLVVARSMTPHQKLLELASLLDLEESIVKVVINRRQPILVSDMEEMVEGNRIFKDERSVMVVPLLIQNEVLGAIYVGAPRPGFLNKEHLHLLSILANEGSIAIRSAQLYDVNLKALRKHQKMNKEMEFRMKQLEGLMELGHEFSTSLSLDESLDAIMDWTLSMLPTRSAALFYYNAESLNMEPWKARGPHSDILAYMTPSRDEGVLGWVAKEKRALLLDDTARSRLGKLLNDEHSVIAAPLMVENEVFAVLYVGAQESGTFGVRHFDLFRTFVYQSALAIRNADLFERVSAMATTDGLTGLYTHRHFHDTLSEEMESDEKHGRAISLIMIDTDHFKKYNDTLGHPEGDAALKEIAVILNSFEGEEDLACRYGGDEFVLLLIGMGKRKAKTIADSIREKVEAHFAGCDVRLTASIGVASFPDDAGEKNELVNAVDAALYRAKEGGRNMVWSA